jgi:hypothetical protein
LDEVLAAIFKLLPGAAGASGLHVGAATDQIVSEHRTWLAEAFSERADETPGVVKLIDAHGDLVSADSGWAMGPAIADGNAVFLEEHGEEYRYRVRSLGAGAAELLSPPDDFWTVAASVGHPGSTAGAVVLWRPSQGTSPSNPGTRTEELWIAGIDRSGPRIVASRRTELTLPDPRAGGITIGGTTARPLLFLIGLPEAGALGAYRTVALTLPGLEPAWETSLDVAAAAAARSTTENGTDRERATEPPRTAITADVLRSMSSLRATALGDCSGWVVAHGTPLRDVLSTSLVFVGTNAGEVTPRPDIHLRDTAALVPVISRPSFALLGVAGGRSKASFVEVEEIATDGSRSVLVNLDTLVGGKNLRDDPHLQPVAIAARGDVILGAAAASGGPGASSADVNEAITTPPTWHQPDRPRVKARLAWLEARAKS